MTSTDWHRVKAILEQALERPPDQRDQYLDAACGGDTELLGKVQEYLRFEAAAEEVLPITDWRRTIEDDAPTADDLERAGPYRMIRRIGEGGSGVVYQAERDDGEYQQLVAVKVVKAGAQAAELARIFRKERRILAQLQHPNIARLIDAGTAANGQLYYVMEYVDGVPITQHCNENRLSGTARLRLFCDVCDAVSYAHRNLIVHRDLKPANILVARAGCVKLLDFGLAKVFQPTAGGEGAAVSTMTMLTPGYASPEQVQGGHLTTATDVYSLGVLLYELLTGRSPYTLRSRSPLEVYRAVVEQQPPPASVAASLGEQAGPGAAGVSPVRLRGDLDKILSKALEKEPERRYASVEDFRRDIDHHLRGFPILAARGNAIYRLGKYVRRHRWSLAASLIVAIGAAAATATVVWQRQQAEMRFNQVRRLAGAVVFELHDAIRDLPGSTAARQLLVERALEYLHNLEASGGKNRELQLEVAAAYQRIGEVQSQPGRGTADTAAAVDSFRRGRRLLLDVLGRFPDDAAAQRVLSDLDDDLSRAYQQRGEERAWRELRKEIAELRWREASRHPGDQSYRARALYAEAYTLGQESDIPAAMLAYQKALDAHEQALAQQPGDGELQRVTARIHAALGTRFQELNDFPSASGHYAEALRLDKALALAAPNDTRAKMHYSWDLIESGWLEHKMGNRAAAVARFELSLALQEEIAHADPDNLGARIEVAKLKNTIGPTLAEAGNHVKAATYLRDAVVIFDVALARDPGNRDSRFHHAWALSNLADVFVRQASGARVPPARATGHWREALGSYERAAISIRPLLAETRPGEWDPHPLQAHLVERLALCARRLRSS